MKSRKNKIEQAIKNDTYFNKLSDIFGALSRRNEQILENTKQNNKQINSLKHDFKWIKEKFKIIEK